MGSYTSGDGFYCVVQMTRISQGAKKLNRNRITVLVRLYFCSVQSPFQDEDFHGLPERLKSSDQVVVLPREKVLPGTGNLSKGTVI